MCKDNCSFTLWSPNDAGGHIEDVAFSCFVMEQEGEFEEEEEEDDGI